MPGQIEAHHAHPLGFNLAAIAVLTILLGLGAAYLLDATARNGTIAEHRLDDETTLTRTLGGVDFEIPRSWFRNDEQQVEGFAKQIDLRLDLPLGTGGALEPVDVTLLPRSRVRPSASLLDGVYLHQFGPDQVSGPPGLVGKPLKPVEGYAGETVWYDPLSGDPFVAKCSVPVAEERAAQCLRMVHLGPGLAAIYAFPQAALAGWRAFDGLIGEKLGQIGALQERPTPRS